MNKTEKLLSMETGKWLARLEKKRKGSEISKKCGKIPGIKNALVNVDAYISDCRHFLAKKDYMNAFEAVVYAWGVYETLERLGLLKKIDRS